LLIKILILLLPAFLFAGEGHTDIIPRTINFLIFAAILYRFIAEPIKNFLKDRSNGILNLLKSIQEKVNESKKIKEEALSNLEASKVLAQNIIEDAKKEAELLALRIQEDFENELKIMQKYYEDKQDIQRRKMVKLVISETIDSLLDKELESFNNKELINIVIKKVA